MNTGLTSTHTARGFSVLYYVYPQKQCIPCSVLRHKCCLTLLYVTLIQDFFCPWNYHAWLYYSVGYCLMASRLQKAACWQ